MQTQMQLQKLSKEIGAKILSDHYLDKKELKKLIAKKVQSMFPSNKEDVSKNTLSKKFTFTVEDAETGKTFQK